MREMTITELDSQLAEQLPARELMGGWHKSSCCGGDFEYRSNENGQFGLLNVNVQNNGDILVL